MARPRKSPPPSGGITLSDVDYDGRYQKPAIEESEVSVTKEAEVVENAPSAIDEVAPVTPPSNDCCCHSTSERSLASGTYGNCPDAPCPVFTDEDENPSRWVHLGNKRVADTDGRMVTFALNVGGHKPQGCLVQTVLMDGSHFISNAIVFIPEVQILDDKSGGKVLKRQTR